jgi:TfoX/Sxy family transcriptional regulator of competence genes
MDFTKRHMKGYVLIEESGMNSRLDFEHWIQLSLDFNKNAKASKKKNKNGSLQ